MAFKKKTDDELHARDAFCAHYDQPAEHLGPITKMSMIDFKKAIQGHKKGTRIGAIDGGPGSGIKGHTTAEREKGTGFRFFSNSNFSPKGEDLVTTYHVSPKKNLSSIFSKGLELRSGEKSGVGGRVALSPSVWMYTRERGEILKHFPKGSKSVVIESVVPKKDIVKTSIEGVIYTNSPISKTNVKRAYTF